MPTHSLLKTKQNLDPIDVETSIKEIIHNKFDNVLKIIPYLNNNEYRWDIRYDDTHRFLITIELPDKIDFEHPDDFFSLWSQIIFEECLVTKYNGQLFDEEYPNQKMSILYRKHNTFKQFLETMLQHSACWKQALILIELSHLPEPLKKF